MNCHKINSNQLQKIKLVFDCLSDVKEKYHETIQIFITKILKSKTIHELTEKLFKEKIAKFILAHNISSNLDSFMNYIVPN
jgi:recombinational DNA repair protein RecR